MTHKLLTSDARLKQLAAVNKHASQRVVDILEAYVKHDMDLYGLPGGPVHDASVIAYLLKPELFSGRRIHLSVDSREGPTFGQTVADWYGVLGKPANVTWVAEGDARASSTCSARAWLDCHSRVWRVALEHLVDEAARRFAAAITHQQVDGDQQQFFGGAGAVGALALGPLDLDIGVDAMAAHERLSLGAWREGANT